MIIFETLVYLILSLLCGLAAMEVKKTFSLSFTLILAFWGLGTAFFIFTIILPMFSGILAGVSAVVIGVIGIASGSMLHRN